MDWLEISVTTDSEAAEAVVELFNRYGHGHAVVEIPQDRFEYELDPDTQPASVIIRTYLRADGSASAAQRRVEEGYSSGADLEETARRAREFEEVRTELARRLEEWEGLAG